MDAKTKKGVDKIIRLSYNKCRWFKQTGEMAEWFMALVLKTSDTVRYRGFESLSLRHFYGELHSISVVQKYPRGRRGSPAKGVGCGKRREGSNPSFCAKKETLRNQSLFCFCKEN